MNIPSSYYERERDLITTVELLNLPPPRHNLIVNQIMAFRQFVDPSFLPGPTAAAKIGLGWGWGCMPLRECYRPSFLPGATAAATDRTPVRDSEVATSAQNTSSSNTSESSNAPVQPSRPKKRRKYGNNDLRCLNGSHYATDLERVNRICTIFDTVPNSDLTLNAQSEFSRFYSNVAWCVRKCHNGDAAAFLESKFAEKGSFLSLKHSYRYTCLECKGTKPRKRVLSEQPSSI